MVTRSKQHQLPPIPSCGYVRGFWFELLLDISRNTCYSVDRKPTFKTKAQVFYCACTLYDRDVDCGVPSARDVL